MYFPPDGVRIDRPRFALRYREYALGDFFRQFELTEAGDQDDIGANLQHGVLTLTLPKVAKAKPRRITVQVT